MRGLTSRWSFRSASSGTSAGGTALLAREPLVARVLAARGLSEPAAAKAFLEPKLTHLHDPSLIPDLVRAAARLLAALAAAEPIVIYGDYDVDGITGTSILFHTLKAIRPDADVRTYVPHRLEEGYGLNAAAINELVRAGARVIVSVDCGVTAVECARQAKALGIDLIITDHHNPPERLADLPDAYAVVHPRRPDSTYPFGDLSGAGVAYKLAWRLATAHCGSHKVDPRLRELLVELLAFAALGTIADIVPLVGENRVIARFGLTRVKASPFTGLRALVEASGLAGEEVDALAAGFRLGPRLNAAGRMGHAREAIELFTVADAARSAAIAADLSHKNEARRAVEKRIFDEAAAMARAAGMADDGCRAIVLAKEDWHTGVVGIVCSRLVEKFHRPTILLGGKHDPATSPGEAGLHWHGSGRSIEGFNLHAALVACHDHLLKYGGHDMAAGMQVEPARLDAFVRCFTAYADDRIDATDLCSRVTIDCEAEFEELTAQAVADLRALEPFGAGNPDVRLLVRDVQIAAPPAPLGAQGKHLSLSLRGSGAGGGDRVLRTVAWGWGDHIGALAPGQIVDAVLKPRLSFWSGRATVEPELCDLKIVR